eukprot:6068179-Pleurochrysis_carterae.AAC.4
MARPRPPSRLHATRHGSRGASSACRRSQCSRTFLRQSGLSPTLEVWGKGSSPFVPDGLRPIFLSELLKHERPATPVHFGPLHPRYLEQLRVVMIVVHYTLLGTLVLQTELRRRDPNGPYVPFAEYANLTTLRFGPNRNDVSDDDESDSGTTPAESA